MIDLTAVSCDLESMKLTERICNGCDCTISKAKTTFEVILFSF